MKLTPPTPTHSRTRFGHFPPTLIFIDTYADFAVGVGGFLTMNLLPGGQLLENWAGGGGVIEGGGAPKVWTGLCELLSLMVRITNLYL